MNRQIPIQPGLNLMAFLANTPPTADDLKSYCFALALQEDQPDGVLEGLVDAYMAQLSADAQERDDDRETYETVSGDEAEDLYRQYAVKGYRDASKLKHEISDERIYESCDLYDFDVKLWPDALLAEIAYVKGYRAAREAAGYAVYAAAQEAKYGPDWWKRGTDHV